KDLLASLPRLPVRFRIASLLTLDHYGTGHEQVRRLQDLDLHVMAPNARFSAKLDQLPSWASQERHFVRKKERLSDAWLDYVSSHPDRVLTMLHFVSESEFIYRGLADRPHRIAVPGVGYHMRQRAQSVLRERGIRERRNRTLDLFRLANRVGLNVFSSFLFLR